MKYYKIKYTNYISCLLKVSVTCMESFLIIVFPGQLGNCLEYALGRDSFESCH